MSARLCVQSFVALCCVVRNGGHKPGNLENSGISLKMENSGNSVQPQGKIVTNKVFLVRHLNICVKQLLTPGGKQDH